MRPRCHAGRRGRRRIVPWTLRSLLTSYRPVGVWGQHSSPPHPEGRCSPPAHRSVSPLPPTSPLSQHPRVPDGEGGLRPALPTEASSCGVFSGWAGHKVPELPGKAATPRCSHRPPAPGPCPYTQGGPGRVSGWCGLPWGSTQVPSPHSLGVVPCLQPLFPRA